MNWESDTASGRRLEVADVRNALLLVDDEVFDDVEAFGLGLELEVRRSISIGAAVVHVDVQIAAPPAARRHVGKAIEDEGLFGGAVRLDAQLAACDGVLRPARRLDDVLTRRQRERARAVRVKIAVLEAPLAPDEGLVGVTPRIVRRVALARGVVHRDACRHRGAVAIEHTQSKTPDRRAIEALAGLDASARSSRDREHPQRRVAVLVRDEGNARTVM